MNTQRLNITLPKALVSRLGKMPNKSAFIAAAIREKLGLEENARKRSELAQAYKEASREEAGLIKDWDGAAGDAL